MDYKHFIFDCKIYNGETLETMDEKIKHSLNHFPNQISDFFVSGKKQHNEGVLVSVEIALLENITLENLQEKFSNIVHLQNHKIDEVLALVS